MHFKSLPALFFLFISMECVSCVNRCEDQWFVGPFVAEMDVLLSVLLHLSTCTETADELG